MAVNRALSYADRLGALGPRPDPSRLHDALELWYLKTRFAYRVPLDEVVAVLTTHPGPNHYWNGGQSGEWLPGENPRP